MNKSIAPEGLRQKILMWAAIAGLFFGLMPPYVFTIVIVATWGVPPMEPPAEQSFRMVYFLRLVLGNVLGLTLGAFLAAAATNLGLRMAAKATYLRGAIGGAVLGAVVGSVTAGSCPFLLLISSTDPKWAWVMIERSFLVGGLMGLINGLFAGLVIAQSGGTFDSVLVTQEHLIDKLSSTGINTALRALQLSSPALHET